MYVANFRRVFAGGHRSGENGETIGMTRPGRSFLRRALAVAAFAWFAAAAPAAANEAQKLIDDSASALRALVDDRAVWDGFRPWFRDAKAVVLAPDIIEAGLVFGGAGGQCLIVARGAGGDWSAPSFCMFGEASVGLQFGFQKSEMVMLVMTDGALAELMAGRARFGGEAGLAAGLVGHGVKRGTTLQFEMDIVALSRNQGFYGGVVLDGGWITPDSAFNQAYYGRAVTAQHILVDRRVTNPAVEGLLAVLKQADQADYAESQRD